MNKEKNRPSTFRAIAFRVIALTLALWLGIMFLLTWAVAEDMLRQLRSDAQFYVYADNKSRDYAVDDHSTDLPGAMERSILKQMGHPYYFLGIQQLLPIVMPQNPASMSSHDWYWGDWDLVYGFEHATICYDENGEIIAGGNRLEFVYTTQEQWQNQSTAIQGHSFVDLDSIQGGVAAFDPYTVGFATGDISRENFLPVLRLTGYFEGSQFHPVTIHRGWNSFPNQDAISSLCRSDYNGSLMWDTVLTTDMETDRDLVTIYAWDLGGILFDYDPVTVDGVQFESLLELMLEDWNSDERYTFSSLWEAVMIFSRRVEDSYGTYTYSLGIHCKPIAYAALRMTPCYLISFAAVSALLFLILWSIRKNLILPLERVYKAARFGFSIMPIEAWEEPYILQQHFADTQQALAEANTEQAQLRTTLEYARDAEERRRQLVSNLAHELKTPLSVIHSYAEGLQAGIAREKLDHYLSVILEESEKMDAMVLQMLDLSRLESGKVRLTMTPFSLRALTQSIADKFAPMLEAKALTFSIDAPEDLFITADEGRMEQVITNLISNALKYTPAGGWVRVRICLVRRSVFFMIENACPHLSEEALQKVWDSFYRADPSRTEPGTGLGLALVKSIVELHQGTCGVRNTTYTSQEDTQTGVEFRFTLPLV